MLYEISHRTHYWYEEPVSLTHNQAHLTPRSTPTQSCLARDLVIDPQPIALDPWLDYFGNTVHFFSLAELHDALTITAKSVVQVSEPTVPAAADTPAWESVRDGLRSPVDAESLAASQFTFESPLVQRLPAAAEFALPSFAAGRPLLDCILELNERIFREFRYQPGTTSIHTPTCDVLAQRRGVCQDFAHLAVCCLRSLGLAARYVSGYLLTDPPPGQPRLIGADASHAWVSAYFPGTGWLDFDPTNNQMPGLRHVTLAWGRDFADVSPVRGVFLGGGNHSVEVAVDVAPRR